jgi:hypothetical protein
MRPQYMCRQIPEALEAISLSCLQIHSVHNITDQQRAWLPSALPAVPRTKDQSQVSKGDDTQMDL